jgi:hypothetical protein
VRLHSRNAYDWTARLALIVAAAELIKAKSFTIDGEAVVLGPDGLSSFEELCRREAARTAILYAFDLIEHGGEDLHDRPFLAGALLRDTKTGIPAQRAHRRGRSHFAHACGLAPRASSQSGWDRAYRSGPCRTEIKVRDPASIAVERERSERWNRRSAATA